MKSVTASLYKALYVLLLILANNFLSTTTTLVPPLNVSLSTRTQFTTTTPAPSLRAPQLQLRQNTTTPAVTGETTSITTTATTTTVTVTLVPINMLEKNRQQQQQHHMSITTIPNALESTILVQKANAKRLQRPTRSSPDLPLTNSTNDTHVQNKRRRSFTRTYINGTNNSLNSLSTIDSTTSTSTPASTTERNHHERKSFRMVQRLAAGHIENAQKQLDITNDITIKISPGNSNNTSKPQAKNELTTHKSEKLIKSMNAEKNGLMKSKSKVKSNTNIVKPTIREIYNNDEALLDSNDDDDDAYAEADADADADNDGDGDSDADDGHWDHGILRLSAGSGKEKTYKLKKSKEESKKTLADQIRDGKYGLIEKELFRKPPKRPGVLSYLPNKEMPHDNEHNYGGLNEDDIWLAEDHLLVIKGGSLNKDNIDEPWPAIDDYQAPDRQIKIPPNPKVPPPFPVQLEENGPVQLIGNNKLTIVYPIANKSLSLYTISQEAHNSPSENNSDDEKNFITRPGTPENIGENQPPDYYTTPVTSWLSQNKTLGPSNLNHSYVPPINYSYLGSFPLVRNLSYDSSLINPDDFDEDDPTLYYPPSYSFVYKSNYTNPVPPGPLVPGIVVPPPYNQFSRLSSDRKKPTATTTTTTTTTRTSTTTITPLWPPRFKLNGNSNVATTATTTMANPQIQTAFRNAITQITEYTPKTINIVSARPSTPVTVAPVTSTAPNVIKSIRVPVAVPVPIYPVDFEATRKPAFVSTAPITSPNTGANTNTDTITKANPFYYEYFEAKRQPTISNIIDDFLATTPNDKDLTAGSLSSKSVKLYKSQNDTNKKIQRPNSSTSTSINNSSNSNNSEEENVVVITPKPEIRYSHRPIYKTSPHFDSFKQEVNALREKLQFYQNQELRENNILRTPKAKAVFEYNFDSVKSTSDEESTNNFQAPNSFDGEPFKPMVTYSPAINDEDAFQALTVDKVDDEAQSRENAQNLYAKYATTTLLPVLGSNRFKKLRLGAKYLHQSSSFNNYQQQQQHIPLEYDNTPRFPNGWLTVNKKENKPPESYQAPLPILNNRNRDFTGYYYQSVQQKRPNNRFYDGPFYNVPNRQIFKYRPQQQQQQQQQQQLPLTQLPEPIWSLENDTYVNYAPNRPPINPDAEFINPYQAVPIDQPYHVHRLPAITMPAYSHQSQYFAPAQRMPPSQSQAQSQPQQLPLRQYQQVSSSNLNPTPGHSLHRDILVNYRQPLPPLNPDSEFIVHPQVVKNNLYRPDNYRLPSATANENSNIYYITPKYRRASVNNNKYNNNHNFNYNNNNNNNHNSQYFNKNKLNSGIINDNYSK